MNTKLILSSILMAVVVAFVSGCATEKSQAERQAKAKISQAQARQTALAKAPEGSVKSFELEEEKGRLVWSFDIATPGTKDITEVLVDAVTGEVVSTEKETPAQQAKEEQEQASEKADKSWKETLTAPQERFSASGRNGFFILKSGTEYKLPAPEVRLVQDGSLRLVKYGFVKK